jgi:hypothetical protein
MAIAVLGSSASRRPGREQALAGRAWDQPLSRGDQPVSDILPNHPDQPPRELRGDLWAQARYAELVALLGGPHDSGEHKLMLTLARLLGGDELHRLLVLIRRAMRAARGD